MKKSAFSDSQILSILKQAEQGVPVTQLCREHGIISFPLCSAILFKSVKFDFFVIKSAILFLKTLLCYQLSNRRL